VWKTENVVQWYKKLPWGTERRTPDKPLCKEKRKGFRSKKKGATLAEVRSKEKIWNVVWHVQKTRQKEGAAERR